MAIDPDLLNTSPQSRQCPEPSVITSSVDNDVPVLPPELLSESLLLDETENAESENAGSADSGKTGPVPGKTRALIDNPKTDESSDNVLSVDQVSEKTYHQKVKQEIAAYLKNREKRVCRRESGKPFVSRPAVKKDPVKEGSLIVNSKMKLVTEGPESRPADSFMPVKMAGEKKTENFSIEKQKPQKNSLDVKKQGKKSDIQTHDKNQLFKEKRVVQSRAVIKTPPVDSLAIKKCKYIYEKKNPAQIAHESKRDAPFPKTGGNLKQKNSTGRHHGTVKTDDQAKLFPVFRKKLTDFQMSPYRKRIITVQKQNSASSERISKKTDMLMRMDIIEKRPATSNGKFSSCQKISPLQLI